MKKTPSEIKSEMWDVNVIGGGVIGCAMIRHFALMGAKSLLLERGPDILSGASKANSALLHTGFDAPPHSLELSCIKRGYQLFLDNRYQFQRKLGRIQTNCIIKPIKSN